MTQPGAKYKATKIKTCKVCGKTFKAQSPNQQICGEECRAIQRKKTYLERFNNKKAHKVSDTTRKFRRQQRDVYLPSAERRAIIEELQHGY